MTALDFVGSHFQSLIHAAIAANRFTAFYRPTNHSRIWGARNTYLLLLVVFVASALFTSATYVAFALKHRSELSEGVVVLLTDTVLTMLDRQRLTLCV